MDEKEVKPIVNQEIDVDDTGSQILSWFKKNIINLFIFGLSIYFVFNGAIQIVPNEMNIWEKCVYIFTTMIFGLIISSLVADNGYTAGKKSEIYLTTRAEADKWCEKVLPWRKEAELYISKKIDNDIKAERIEILAKASIEYDEIFNENDVPYKYKDIRKVYSKKQRRAIVQAIKVKKVPFALFGVSVVKSVGRKEAPSESKRRKSKFTSSFIIKAFMAIASGSIAFQFLGISVSSIIYSVFQLFLWFGSGIYARLGNYNFITENVCKYDQERILYLKEFDVLSQEEKDKLREEVSMHEAEKDQIKRLTMTIDNQNKTN